MVADNLETGDLRHWASVVEGDAAMTVDWAAAHTGRCSGRITITSSFTSRANLTAGLPAAASEVWADGWFRVDGEGAGNSNVGFFRFFDGSNRIVDVYRQNVSGELWVRVPKGGSWDYIKLGPVLGIGEWHRIKLHVVAAGAGSRIEIWLDGSLVYSVTRSLPTTRFTSVLLGSEHQRQVMDLRFDDILVVAS